jgi:DNA-binding XRE family transcriptional regulator
LEVHAIQHHDSMSGDDDQKKTNRVQTLREDRLLSKAELARRSGLSVLTIDRVEKGAPCRLDTKRKIILALGLKVTDREQVFTDDDEG